MCLPLLKLRHVSYGHSGQWIISRPLLAAISISKNVFIIHRSKKRHYPSTPIDPPINWADIITVNARGTKSINLNAWIKFIDLERSSGGLLLISYVAMQVIYWLVYLSERAAGEWKCVNSSGKLERLSLPLEYHNEVRCNYIVRQTVPHRFDPSGEAMLTLLGEWL